MSISIHSPRMGRDDINKQLDYHDYISIHSPRMGRDETYTVNPKKIARISIHSPRMGRDDAVVS